MKCQAHSDESIIWFDPNTLVETVKPVVCTNPVSAYRSCGAGCRLEIAYCKEHGGDEKAVEEMREHVQKEHQQ